MKRYFITSKTIMLTMVAAMSYWACQPDDDFKSNGLTSPGLSPEFTITPVTVEGKINTYQFSLNERENVLGIFWDLGEGTYVSGRTLTDVTFFPDEGTYEIRTKVIGKGGAIFEGTETLVVENPDPKYGNQVRNGKFTEGNENWDILSYSGGATPTFADGKVLFNYGNWAHAGIYTSFEAEAGKKYRVDMTVSGKGASDTWFEVYIGQSDPATFAGDYNEGGTRLGLNTWTGCGKTAFADKLTKLSCVGSSSGDNNGVFEVASSGTYYLVIRTGGANLGDGGISLDNVEIRPYYEEED